MCRIIHRLGVDLRSRKECVQDRVSKEKVSERLVEDPRSTPRPRTPVPSLVRSAPGLGSLSVGVFIVALNFTLILLLCVQRCYQIISLEIGSNLSTLSEILRQCRYIRF